MLQDTDLVQSFSQAREAIEGRLSAVWDMNFCPVQFGNTGILTKDTSNLNKPSKTPQWISHNIIGGAVFTNEVTNSITNVTGFININIFTDTNIGSDAALKIADQLFNIYNQAVFNGIQCAWASLRVAPPNNGWYQVNISIPYTWQRCLG